MPKKNRNNSRGYRARNQWHQNLQSLMRSSQEDLEAAEINIGKKLQELRASQGLSLRGLADLCGLSFNTLSLIENEKTSPNVSTLQQLALALQVPIAVFFETSTPHKDVVFQKAGKRPSTLFPHGELEDLGEGLTLGNATPLLLVSKPLSNSGPNDIVHTGQEFVYCLEGEVAYFVEQQEYLLEPHDSILFQAQLPHRWENRGAELCKAILIICPSDVDDRLVSQHLENRQTDFAQKPSDL